MSMTDLMNHTPASLMETAAPGWKDRSYGDYFRAAPGDWLSMVYPSLAGGTQPATRPRRGHPGHHEHGHEHGHHHPDCGCHEHDHHHHHEHDHGCDPDPCECHCCLGDVDIAVYTRVGEERVVPIVIENERRRESEVRLELSDWTTRAGNPSPVETVRLGPEEFTLEPCGHKDITLVLRVAAPRGAGEEERLEDVEACLVVTADLRLVGCEHRPVRIAAAILPRYCDPSTIGCGCSCC
jgi:hypothetical protein